MKAQGFTLVEVMVVVVILGILAAVVVPNLVDKPHEARVSAAKTAIKAFESSLELYKLDNFDYPSTEQGLEALVNQPTGAPEAKNWKQYVRKLKPDPWGNDYVYLNPGEHGEIDIFSMGKDGRVGGEEENADIGNWE